MLLIRLVPLAFLGASLLIVPLCLAADYTALVVSVLDGDILEILHKQSPERIRLRVIDFPEKGQPYGYQARQATVAMVLGKEVLLQTHGRGTQSSCYVRL